MFEKVRINSFKNYGLSPSHYLRPAGLSWDAMLKIIKVNLKLIPDPDMWIFFEKVIRGGISYISNRYCKAKNKYLNFYDTKQESKHIVCLDANNNMYGYVMSRFLPTTWSNWIDPKEFDLNKYTSNS